MENKTKEDGKKLSFNIIDAFIVLFVLACVIGIAVKLAKFNLLDSNARLEEYSIIFSVSEMAHTSPKYLIEGDLVTLSDRNVVIGTLDRVSEIEPSKAYAKNSDGNIILAPYPEKTRVDVKGSISSKGVLDRGKYMLGGSVHIAKGEIYRVATQHVDFLITVTDIVKK